MFKKLYKHIFFVVLFVITYLFYIFPFEMLNKYLLNESINFQYSLINTAIFYVLIIYYLRSHNTFKPLKIFVYEGLGIGFISFMVISVSILINLLGFFQETSIGITSLIIIFILSAYGIINARNISIKNIELTSAKINNNFSIIFLSDIHLGTNSTKHLKKILNKIKTIKYDFIIIGGDLIDSGSFNINDLNILKEIKKNIYFVNGNHEYYLKDYKNKIAQLKNFNIRVLKNTCEKIDQINLIGVDDMESEYSKISYVTKLKKDNLFNLVVSHKPDIWDNINNKAELMLSGHTHNGQIFPFNLIVKLKFKYIYGLYKNKKSRLYVSSGSGCWGPKLRIGSSNEIININLTAEN
jgi:uncharacterized protein